MLFVKFLFVDMEDVFFINFLCFGMWLKFVCQICGMIFKVFVEVVNCLESLFFKIENGKVMFLLFMLYWLVGVLGINIGWMFEEVDGEEQMIFCEGKWFLIVFDLL